MRRPTLDVVLGHPVILSVVCICTLVTLGSIASPDHAAAFPMPSPADLLTADKLIPGGLNPSSWVTDGFKAILKFIFGDIDDLGKHLVNLLLAVPLLTDAKAFPKLNQYREYVTGGAWGLLSLSFVVASMRYWLASYTGAGAYEGAQGFVRSCAAIAGLLVFIPLFDQVARLTNAFTSALVANPIVGDNLGKGMTGVLDTGLISGGGIPMLVAIVAIMLAITLLVVKVIITALLAVLFVASPLALALWPIEEFAYLFRTLLQAMMGLLLFPVIWALCFGTFATLSVDALFPGEHGSQIPRLLGPLVMLAALIVAFRLPFAVLRQAMQAGISPGLSRGVRNVQVITSSIPSGRWAKSTPGMKS
jgi:hypothetical protein